LLTKSEAEL
jgi:chromosome segregation ATPase